ncbi:MAG TPA: heme-binding protein, partial [Verrucomicrobiae bacterium]|nr:heme-binding protein [Verrucomicrobiae bacterium]
MLRPLLVFLLTFLGLPLCFAAPAGTLVYKGGNGPGAGKKIVFLAGDEEYRSEEGLPELAKILAVRHGFTCTVLFSINPADGVIDPNTLTNEPGVEALDSADLIFMQLRFRHWPDSQMRHFVDAFLAGKPIIALRTSTHAFSYGKDSQSPYASYSWDSKIWPGGFGKQVLGETWVSHHGAHKKEATRGIIPPEAAGDPLLRGVSDIFGTTDVYTANPPPDVRILLRGEVLAGMQPDSPPVDGPKNHPMQPIAWTRDFRNEAGHTNRIFCTTMGAATDLLNEDLRRLLVNAVYAGVGLSVPKRADARIVGSYAPSNFGFDGFKRGVKPADLELSAASKSAQAQPKLELRPGDHIALIGNALADRFQHSGWLEADIYSRFP